MRVASEWERMVMVGRKGGETNPPKTIPGMGCSHRSTWAAKRPWKGPISGKKRTHTYQAREVQEPKKKKQTRKKGSGGMVEVGRRGEGASPPKPIVGSKRSCPEKKTTSTPKMGAADCGAGLGGTGNEPTQADAWLVIIRTEQNPRFRWQYLYNC